MERRHCNRWIGALLLVAIIFLLVAVGEAIAATITFDAYGAHLASGGLPPVLQANTASNKTWLMLNSPQSRTTLVVSLGASAAPIRVSDMVVTDTTAAITNSRHYAWVTAVSSDTGVNVLTLEGTGLPTTPTIGNPIYPVAYSQFALGTSIIPKFAVLGVADFINGAQVVHYAAKAQPTGEWGEALRGGQHVMVPISMNLFGHGLDPVLERRPAGRRRAVPVHADDRPVTSPVPRGRNGHCLSGEVR